MFLVILGYYEVLNTRRNNLRFTLNLHFRFVIDISFSRVDFHFFPFHRNSGLCHLYNENMLKQPIIK